MDLYALGIVLQTICTTGVNLKTLILKGNELDDVRVQRCISTYFAKLPKSLTLLDLRANGEIQGLQSQVQHLRLRGCIVLIDLDDEDDD